MPTTPSQLDPEKPLAESDSDIRPEAQTTPRDLDAPLTFVPHQENGRVIAAPSRIRTNRFGELEEHELIKLLDSIEDERARGRFRESIYISIFVWMVIAWVVLYGPKYLWHAPTLISPVDVMKQHEMVELNAPVLRHPVVPPPKLDAKTMERLRAAEPRPVATPAPVPPTAQPTPTPAPVPAPLPTNTAPAPNLPAAPAPTVSRAPTPEAPAPQPTTKPNFSTPATASDAMRNAVRDAARNRGGASGVESRGSGVYAPNGAMAGGGVEVLSDLQGVDFSQYIAQMRRDLLRNWIPLLPEETAPPLSKKGDTFIVLTVLPDGSIGDMKLENSSHDVAIDKAAWNSILAEGKFPPLPSHFHGPNLMLRWHYVVNQDVR
jgi:outer membrane biosynthesis protein TonB